MKTKIPVVVALAAATIAWFASAAFAGPPSQFPRPAEKNTDSKITATVNAKLPTVACAMCQNTPVVALTPGLPLGKGLPRSEQVGTKHTCSGCTGAVTAVRGVVRDNMVRTACATAGMKCCI